ncbi:uncharacterized protein LOC117815733 [Notolabrus celidotus]|uniref:uncharacterized protein LOC117815733 n=1 Tax=Notolabrus celidotus TaxID=1203425 RepID=UPI00148F7A05|nr:uncharacterized protein LOC117815733 [Notolabrus celidotus]
MERNKRTPLLFFFLPILHVCTIRMVQGCDSQPGQTLYCHSDYNRTVTCEWNSTYEDNHECILNGKGEYTENKSCKLKPVDVSRPTLQKCSMVFGTWDEIFQKSHTITINLICDCVRIPVTTIYFWPSKLIKLDPPQKPEINLTNVSVVPAGAKKRNKIKMYRFEIQWKHEKETWRNDRSKVQIINKSCEWNCTAQLFSDALMQGERYEARVRVQAVMDELKFKCVGSDWSPTTSWVSRIGRPPKVFLDEPWIISITVTCAVVLALIMAVITLKRNKTVWIFLITKIKGQPIPNPAKSFLKDVNFQSYLSSRLTNLFTPLEITSIEIVSPVKLVPFKPEAELLEKMKSKSSYDSSNSGFSNPSYAHLGSAPPVTVSLLTAGNLDPCAADTPYGPVCSQSEDKDAGQEREEVREKDVKILKLLSNGCNKGNPPLVISDYERVEKVQLERSRLQSLDSGVCSGEEPSQESLEADSINVTESHDEINEEREAGKETEGVFQKLFGGNVDISGKGSIQVCYDYERVQKLQPDSPELQSLDVNNEIEEHFGHQESLEDTDKSSESTNLLPPPCSFSSVTAMSSNLNGPAFRPAPHCNILALMTTRWSLEASGDGYMPKQVES